MRMLGLETTTSRPGVALWEDGRVIREYLWESTDTGRDLLPAVQYLLDGSGWDVGMLERIVVSTGPGSWTGIRLGIAAAKGFAAGRPEKVFAVSVFENILLDMPPGERRPVCCCVNAFQKKFFHTISVARFMPGRHPAIRIAPFEEIVAKIKRETLLAGPGIPDLLAACRLPRCLLPLPVSFQHPSPGRSCRIACEKIRRGIASPVCEPFYGR